MSASFAATVASSLAGVSAANVTVTSLSRHHRRRGRALLGANSTTVAFSVAYDSSSAAFSATTAISSLATSASFAAALRAAGVPASGVALAVAPTVSYARSGAVQQNSTAALSSVDSLLSSLNASASFTVSTALLGSLGSAADVLNSIQAAPTNSSGSGGTSAADEAARLALQRQLERQRETLLTVIASSLSSLGSPGAAPLSAEQVTGAASVLVQLTAAPSQLTPAAQASAVTALSALSQSAANISTDTANLLVRSLDGVVAAAVGGGSTSAEASPEQAQQTLRSTLNIVNNVALGQGSRLNDTDAPPVEIITSSIQIALRLDEAVAPGPNGTLPRLFSQPLTAQGAEAEFDPLPLAALGSLSGQVLSQFVSLAFGAFPRSLRAFS